MTQKELLYVEDAVGHENTIIEVCRETINMLQDEDLKTYIEEQLEKHNDMKEQLISILEVKQND